MGRELKRVPFNFNWALNKVWDGYIDHYYTEGTRNCPDCKNGYSKFAKKLHDQWYGHGGFYPELRNSVPLTPHDNAVWEFAKRNVKRNPSWYGVCNEVTILQEAKRLCDILNHQWAHHLNDDDVKALVESSRLMDFTHDFIPGEGWVKKEPFVIPTAREVNLWSLSGIGHDSINSWVCIEAECKKHSESTSCSTCNGEGKIWISEELKMKSFLWKPTEPPKGYGFQLWETVSEGSPISPVFMTPSGLARWLVENPVGTDEGTTYKQWMDFIEGPGWAPSMVMSNGQVKTGVQSL
jgi:hypothetical protein